MKLNDTPKKQRTVESRQQLIASFPENITWVGVDPGRRCLLSARWGQWWFIQRIEWTPLYSTQIKYADITHESKIEEINLSEFMKTSLPRELLAPLRVTAIWITCAATKINKSSCLSFNAHETSSTTIGRLAFIGKRLLTQFAKGWSVTIRAQ